MAGDDRGRARVPCPFPHLVKSAPDARAEETQGAEAPPPQAAAKTDQMNCDPATDCIQYFHIHCLILLITPLDAGRLALARSWSSCLNSFRCAQPRAPGTGICRHLRLGGSKCLSLHKPQPPPQPAPAHRQARRTNAGRRHLPHEILHNPVFQRVERDHRDAATRPAQLHRRFQTAPELVQFVIHSNPQRLKNQCRRMNTAVTAELDPPYQIGQLDRACDRLPRTFLHDSHRKSPGEGFLTISPKNPCQLLLARFRENVRRRPAKPTVLPHVQRAIFAKTEAALRRVELMR